MAELPPIRIPFNRPTYVDGANRAMLDAIRGGHTAGGGPYGLRCEEILGRMAGRPVLLVSSCTHALEMAALLLEIRPGDEVIVPSFTFVSTANAFALRGAKLRFADCDSFGNVDLSQVERLLSARTRAVVPVHYGGNSCDMDRLLALCGERKIPVVEDAAQSAGAGYKGRPLGALGTLGCYSFHETKNLVAGEGGGLTAAPGPLLDRAHHLRDKGTNRREFRSGLADKYTWVDLGSSWVMSDLNAAYLSAQLDCLEAIARRRSEIWNRYASELDAPARRAGVSCLKVPAHNEPNHHLFALILKDLAQRDRFILFMRERGILTPFHYVSLHSSPFGRAYHEGGSPLPMTERLSDCLVRLPLFYNLSEAEQGEVIAAASEFLAKD